MSWEIRIPYQDRSQTIRDAIEAHVDQSLEGEDRAIAFQLFLTTEFKTLGELIDHVESLDGDGRRRLLNEKRAESGLDSIEDVEGHARFEAANRALRMGPSRDEQGRRFVGCAEPSCNVWPQGPQGEPIAVLDRVWWCDRHKDQAGPDDQLPPDDLQPRIDLATMQLLPSKAEQERLIEEDRKREGAVREREKHRREESERLWKLEEEYRATLPGLPVGWGPAE
jgi:hypothetical protein